MGMAALVAAAACAAAVVVLRRQMKKAGGQMKKVGGWARAETILRELEEKCGTPTAKLLEVANALAKEMFAGLESEGGSKLKMLVGYDDNLPTGDENGLFYALDLGKTNFRVMRVQLGGKESTIKQECNEFSIPPHRSSHELYDFIAEALAKFVATEGEDFHLPAGRQRELGITCSFPVRQLSKVKSTLVYSWEGFFAEDVVGLDVVGELTQALKRVGVDMRVAALVNDIVGTLAEGHYGHPDAIAAVILGAGTNAAYIEFAQDVPKWRGRLSKSGELVVNMEWGNFRSSHLPLTEYDHSLDAESLNPGEQIFEKIISGMYLGEIVRRVLCRMAEEASFFGDNIPPKLNIPFILGTSDMAAMHHDSSDDLVVVGSKLRDILEVPNSSFEMRKMIVELCDVVASRGARLAAAGIFAILTKLERECMKELYMPRSFIVLGGELCEYYTEFRKCMEATLKELPRKGAENIMVMETSNNSSGFGAALLAACHSQQ